MINLVTNSTKEPDTSVGFIVGFVYVFAFK